MGKMRLWNEAYSRPVLTSPTPMGPSLDRIICETDRYVKQYIFNGEDRQFYLMHSKNSMNIINSMVG